jgi:ribosome maturation factor RimP
MGPIASFETLRIDIGTSGRRNISWFPHIGDSRKRDSVSKTAATRKAHVDFVLIWIGGYGKQRTKLGLITKVDPGDGPAFFVGTMTELIEKMYAIALPVVQELDYDLVTLTFQQERSGWVLRLMVEQPGSDPFIGSGVDHAICSRISRRLGELLEGEDIVGHPFVLEVSSPGIERPLVTERDYQRFLGRRASLRLNAPMNEKKKYKGTLLACADGFLRIRNDTDEKEVEIPMNRISSANLIFDRMPSKKTGER